MANPFVHVELNTPDPEKAKAFYSKLFQWELEEIPNSAVPSGTYTMVKVGTGTGGGIMKQVPGGLRDGSLTLRWMTFTLPLKKRNH